MENSSSDNEINLSTLVMSYKKLKREEIKREIMDYKEDIPCDQIEPGKKEEEEEEEELQFFDHGADIA